VSEVIAAIVAAVTTGIAVYANVHVMRLCRMASREGRAVHATFGLLPSVRIDERPATPLVEPPEPPRLEQTF
jgi:hypothetical protein